MKKLLKIMGVAVVVALVAVVAIYIHAPIKKTNAQSGAPTASITWDSNAGWHISLSSDGPFTQDIQAKICVTSNNSTVSGVSGGASYPYVYCATTPWASQTTASSPGWSPWIWPGYDNGLYVGPSTIPEHVSVVNGVPQYGVVSVTLNTQPLPIAGETLSNVSLGLDVAETNGGPSNYNTPYVACEYGFTPTGGGVSSAIHGYVYQNCSSLSTWVDSVQAGISATLNALPNAQLSSDNIPTSFNVNETKTSDTDGNPLNIVMQNTGATTWASDLHTVVGAPTGTCTYDSNGDGVNDAPIPNAANKGASCAASYDYSSSQIKLQHTASSFSLTPETIRYSNIVKITNTVVYLPPAKYCAEYSGSGGYNSALKIIPQWLIKTALAAPLNGNSHCIDWEYTDPYYYISSSPSGSLDILPGSIATFNISSIKAPSTPGTYNETWQMEQNGSSFGSPAVIPITVGNGGTISVTSEDAMNTSTLVDASWDLTGPVTNSAADGTKADSIVCSATGNVVNKANSPITVSYNGISCSGEQVTYSGLPADNSDYTLPDATTAVPGYTLRSIERVSVAEKKDNSLLGSLQLSLKNMFSTIAFAERIETSIGGGPLYQFNSATLTPQYPSAAFVILWTSTAANPTPTSTPPNPTPTSTPPNPTSTPTSTPPSTAGYDCTSNNQCVYVASNAQYNSASSCSTACALSTTTTPPLAACTPGVTCPVCNPPLTANPTSIVVPESSSLSYSCSHVTQCQISGAQTGKFSNPTNVPASGSYNVTSSITTTYTLACVNGDYARNANNPMQPESATVTVNGSSYCEQNPNGVGCQ